MTATAVMMGSPLYMAPEQMVSARDVDGRADIWSLGIILHTMLVGSPPFRAANVMGVYELIMAGATPIPEAPRRRPRGRRGRHSQVPEERPAAALRRRRRAGRGHRRVRPDRGAVHRQSHQAHPRRPRRSGGRALRRRGAHPGGDAHAGRRRQPRVRPTAPGVATPEAPSSPPSVDASNSSPSQPSNTSSAIEHPRHRRPVGPAHPPALAPPAPRGADRGGGGGARRRARGLSGAAGEPRVAGHPPRRLRARAPGGAAALRRARPALGAARRLGGSGHVAPSRLPTRTQWRPLRRSLRRPLPASRRRQAAAGAAGPVARQVSRRPLRTQK